MKNLMTALLLLVATLQACAQAHAQTQSIWRCGPNGSSYASTPCNDGKPVALAGDDRPASDLAQARQSAASNQALAARLTRERQQREVQSGAAAAGIYGIRPATPTSAAVTSKPTLRAQKKQPPGDADTWRAVVPASRHAKG